MSVTGRTSNLRVDSIWFVIVTEQNMSRWGVDKEIYIKAWTIQHLWEIKDIWESWETLKNKVIGFSRIPLECISRIACDECQVLSFKDSIILHWTR